MTSDTLVLLTAVVLVAVAPATAVALPGGGDRVGATDSFEPADASSGLDDPRAVTDHAKETVNGTSEGTTNETATNETATNETATNETATNETANVSAQTGRQLATTLAAAGEATRENVSQATLTAQFQRANETERATLIAQRAAALTDRAASVGNRQRNLTAAYRAGNLTTGEYAFQLALLNVRATAVERDLERLDRLASEVSRLELAAAGYDSDRVTAALSTVRSVTGPTAAALQRQFTDGGRSRVAVGDGTVSVSSDRSQSREIEREPDDNTTLVVDQATALETARGALSADAGNWTLRESDVDAGDGTYGFAFGFTAGNTTGEASVTVDGSTGTVVELKEEIETETDDRGRPDDPGRGDERGERGEDDEGDDEDEGDGEDESDDRDADEAERDENARGGAAAADELSLLLIGGAPAPNETVRVRVLDRGPVANATVSVDGAAVATTDETGAATVRLPDAERAVIRAERNGTAGQLTVSFDRRTGDELDATGSVTNGTVTVRVTYDDEPATGVRASVDGERVGVTGPDGRVSFAADPGETVVRLQRGQFAATLRFTVGNDSISSVESEVDDERGEDGEDEDEREDGENERDEDEREDGENERDEDEREDGSEGDDGERGEDGESERGGDERGEDGESEGNNGDGEGERGADNGNDETERDEGERGEGGENERAEGSGNERGEGGENERAEGSGNERGEGGENERAEGSGNERGESDENDGDGADDEGSNGDDRGEGNGATNRDSDRSDNTDTEDENDEEDDDDEDEGEGEDEDDENAGENRDGRDE